MRATSPPATQRAPVPSRRAVLVVSVFLLAVDVAGFALAKERRLGADFGAHYAVSLLLHREQAELIASGEALTRLTEEVLRRPLGDGLYPWPYPPMALLVVYPLAFLPPVWAYLLAMAAGLAAYLSAVVRVLGLRREVVLAALAFPGVLLTLVYGHTSFLTTALLGGALALLPRRPLQAGVLLGLLSFKPHLGLVVPVALVAGRRWRAALAASATVIGFAAAATAAFGWQPWVEFFRSARAFASGIGAQATTQVAYQSVFSAVRLAGGGGALASAAQAIATASAAAVVWRVWSGEAREDLKAAVLVLAALLVPPYLCDYDLTLLAIPVAFLVKDGLQHGWRGREPLLLLVASLVPGAARSASSTLHVSPVPPIVILVLWAATRRALESSRGATGDRRPGRGPPVLSSSPG